MTPTTQQSSETAISNLTTNLLTAWNARIDAGNKRAISDLQNTVLDRLSQDECKALFIKARTDRAAAEAGFAELIADAMREACFIEASRAVVLLQADLIEQRADDIYARIREVAA